MLSNYITFKECLQTKEDIINFVIEDLHWVDVPSTWNIYLLQPIRYGSLVMFLGSKPLFKPCLWLYSYV